MLLENLRLTMVQQAKAQAAADLASQKRQAALEAVLKQALACGQQPMAAPFIKPEKTAQIQFSMQDRLSVPATVHRPQSPPAQLKETMVQYLQMARSETNESSTSHNSVSTIGASSAENKENAPARFIQK